MPRWQPIKSLRTNMKQSHRCSSIVDSSIGTLVLKNCAEQATCSLFGTALTPPPKSLTTSAHRSSPAALHAAAQNHHRMAYPLEYDSSKRRMHYQVHQTTSLHAPVGYPKPHPIHRLK